MKESDAILLDSLSTLREQYTSDFTGDYSEIKEKIDIIVNDILDKIINEEKEK
jgi:hypothetical protein